jgi:hypothetical protein
MIQTETAKRIVQERAISLKRDGKGYFDTLHIIAGEIVDSEHGKETDIGRRQARAPSMPIPFPWGPLIELAKLISKHLSEERDRAEREAETKRREAAGRQEHIDKAISLITPWIDEVWNK